MRTCVRSRDSKFAVTVAFMWFRDLFYRQLYRCLLPPSCHKDRDQVKSTPFPQPQRLFSVSSVSRLSSRRPWLYTSPEPHHARTLLGTCPLPRSADEPHQIPLDLPETLNTQPGDLALRGVQLPVQPHTGANPALHETSSHLADHAGRDAEHLPLRAAGQQGTS